MHVLILGAKGMLGRALTKAFETEEVITWDRDDLDITNEAEVMEHIPIVDPDVVINAAAYTDVEKAEDEEQLAAKVNGDAVGFIAKSCAQKNIPVVHFSTDYVFDGTKQEGYLETDTPGNPLNAYGRTKLLGEQKLQENTNRFWLVRTAWLFGPHGKHFVDTMLRLSEKGELKVVNDQHGCPTYTKDLAQAIFKMVWEKSDYGIYHLTNGSPTTWFDFAQEIFKQSEKKVNVIPTSTEGYPYKAKRPLWSVLKNTKRPLLRNWHEALKDYLNIRDITHP